MFSHDTPENLIVQVHLFVYAHSTQPFSHLHVPPYETVFHTQPPFPLIFTWILSHKQFHAFDAQYCSELQLHSQNQATDLNPLFHIILLKPLSTWFLAIETAMLQMYSKIYQNEPKKKLLIQCKTHPILTDQIPYTSLF